MQITRETAQYTYSRTGLLLKRGDLLEAPNGQTWTFERLSRPAGKAGSGRVLMSAACMGASGYGYCTHPQHVDGIVRRAFHPGVFNLYLGDLEGDPIA